MQPIDVDVNLANVARRRVNARIGFLIHCVVFFVVNTFLFALNLNSDSASFWAKWPLMGWGLGLILHGLMVFIGQVMGNWREKMIHREMTRLS